MNEPEPRHGLHVLVAEDSPTQAELLRQALAGAGYAVSVACNGLDALASARSMRPAVVITDVLMPDMDGYQLCRAIKTDPALHDVPVMLVTSLQGIDDIVTALESGADNFIRKPFDNDSLLARLDFLLANRKLRAQRRLQSGIEISLGGRRHLVTAGREQILDLLFSSYEEALQANQELRERQQEVQGLNLQLATRAVELEDANAQLRSFSHCVSHDLRSPLATISGFSALLLQKHAAGLDPRAVHFLEAIQQETGRMVRIVEDVLHLAGIERANVTRTEVDLAAEARAAIDRLRQAQPDREVLFDCPAAAAAACDVRLLRIALANLLGNAWKFTGKRAPARIAFRTLEGGTVFCVEDNGAGFDMAQAHRLFKPFERLHRSEEFQGFGIGLATVQRVVALHGGRVWAESAPGEGARFCFTLQPARA